MTRQISPAHQDLPTDDVHSPDDFYPPGSPPNSEPVFLLVGKLLHPHAVRGELLMAVLTDFPERLKPGVSILIGIDHKPFRIRSCRKHKEGLLIAFDGILSPELAGEFRNQFVYVKAADRPQLPDGEYYHHQLLGLKVVDDSGVNLGVLSEILTTGANDVYVVRNEVGQEILLPVIDDVILETNLSHGEIRVHVLPGLLSDR